MALFNLNNPFRNGKKKSSFGGTSDSTDKQKKEEAIYNELYDSKKITESNDEAHNMVQEIYKERYGKTKKEI